ncbi:MAG: putative baseplate assembly protein, partial [Candidatus Thermoplasmatota archaeon]|nr:putative baseplate assembly protein [Candidatus Thermoplasmatota archaeon]
DKDVNIDLMVYLYEADLGPIGRPGEEGTEVISSAEVRWEYLKNMDGKQEWADLEIVRDETMAFTYSGTISLVAPEDMTGWRVPAFEAGENERYWIRCRVMKAGYEISPRIDAIQLNTVPVTEGETVEESLSGTGQPDQTHCLQHRPVLAGSLVLSILDKTWEEWVEVDDLDASGPEDPHYLVEYDAGRISFGDGIHGLIPPDGTGNIKAAYRSGGGENGNMKAGTIDQILDEGFGMLVVRNDQAASGGAREETLEEAIFRARKDLKERYRAVTSDDYEYITKKTPGLRVKRAKSIPDKDDGSVTVVVVPESTSDKPVNPSEGFRRTVCKHLDRHRLITTGIHVRGPEYVKVSVNATAKIKSGYESDTVRSGIEDALKRFLHPTRGGYDGEGWQFGRSVFRSEISGLIDGIDGVDCVYELDMADGGKSRYDGEKIAIPKEGLVYLGDYSIRIKGPNEGCRVKEGLL